MAKMLNNLMANVVGPSSSSPTLAESKLGDAYLVSMMATDIVAEANRKACDPGEEEDVHKRLAQKETDLVLAAEVGKALLDKNEELQRQNEAMEQGYAERIEVREIFFYSEKKYMVS